VNKIKALLIASIATLLAVAGGLILVPADAGTCSSFGCGRLWHIAPDDGYDAPIIVTCDWNTKAQTWVYEGDWSPCKDTDGFYTRPGDRTVCKWRSPYVGGWVAYGPGWTKFTDGIIEECVSQKA
jgi:hypothetical protein